MPSTEDGRPARPCDCPARYPCPEYCPHWAARTPDYDELARQDELTQRLLRTLDDYCARQVEMATGQATRSAATLSSETLAELKREMLTRIERQAGRVVPDQDGLIPGYTREHLCLYDMPNPLPRLRPGSAAENEAIRTGTPPAVFQDVWLHHAAVLAGTDPSPEFAEVSWMDAGPAQNAVRFDEILGVAQADGEPGDTIPALLLNGEVRIEAAAAGSVTEDQARWLAGTLNMPLHPGPAGEVSSGYQQLRDYQVANGMRSPLPDPVPEEDRLTQDEILSQLYADRRAGDPDAERCLDVPGYDFVFGYRTPLWRCSFLDPEDPQERPCGAEIKWGGEDKFILSEGWYHAQTFRWKSHEVVPPRDAHPDKAPPA